MYLYQQINRYIQIQEPSAKIQYSSSNKTSFIDKLFINKKQIDLEIAVHNYTNSIGRPNAPEFNNYIKRPNLNIYEKALKS